MDVPREGWPWLRCISSAKDNFWRRICLCKRGKWRLSPRGSSRGIKVPSALDHGVSPPIQCSSLSLSKRYPALQPHLTPHHSDSHRAPFLIPTALPACSILPGTYHALGEFNKQKLALWQIKITYTWNNIRLSMLPFKAGRAVLLQWSRRAVNIAVWLYWLPRRRMVTLRRGLVCKGICVTLKVIIGTQLITKNN